jgi:hypothetical protein
VTLSPTYTGVEQRPFGTSYVWAETVLDHPVETVWPVALDLPLWMNANHEWEQIAGEQGKPGVLYRLWPRHHYVGDDCPPPHYHWVGIAKVIRPKIIGVEVWAEKGGSYGDRFVPPSYKGLDNLILTDLGGRTHMCGLFIAVTDPQADQQVDATEDQAPAANVQTHFDNLKRALEGTPIDPPATESFRAVDSGTG